MVAVNKIVPTLRSILKSIQWKLHKGSLSEFQTINIFKSIQQTFERQILSTVDKTVRAQRALMMSFRNQKIGDKSKEITKETVPYRIAKRKHHTATNGISNELRKLSLPQ